MQPLTISQSALSLLSICPRKFEYTYLEKLYFPLHEKDEELRVSGVRFHKLMEQRELGINIDPMLQLDPTLKKWMDDFKAIAPEIFNPTSNVFRQAEYRMLIPLKNFPVLVIYDLFLLDGVKAEIHDWKTNFSPTEKQQLLNSWQTKLYCYVLKEIFDYEPENISMTYWFVRSQEKVQLVYSEEQHQSTKLELVHLLNQLNNWIEDYKNQQHFPKTVNTKVCDTCQYNFICYPVHKSTKPLPLSSSLSIINEIEEVAI